MSKQRRYSADCKLGAVSRMEHCETITGSAKELGIRRKFLYQWRDQLQAGGKAALERRRGRPPGSQSKAACQPTTSAAESRIAELERLLGRKQLEGLDGFRGLSAHPANVGLNPAHRYHPASGLSHRIWSR
jgi:transposase-like protein